MDKKPEAWSQQTNEDFRCFEAFKAYRDMDPGVRSVKAAAESYHGADYHPRDYVRWGHYSRKHDWKDRAMAWDRHRDEQVQEAELESLRRMRQEQVERARNLQRIADMSLERELIEMEADPNKKLNPALILQFATQGASMERVVRGEPSAIIQSAAAKDVIQIEWGGAPNDGTEGTSEGETADTSRGSEGDH